MFTRTDALFPYTALVRSVVGVGKIGPRQAVGLRDIKTILGYLDVAHAISLAIAGPAHRHGDIAWTIALHEADAGTQRQRFRNRGSRLVGALCAIAALCGLRDRLCILPPTGNDGVEGARVGS